MSERVLPQGQQWINMRGEIKTVAKHLAFDVNLQKSSGFFPCDANGVQINNPEQPASTEPQKKIADVAVSEPVIEIPKGLDIVNPDEAVEVNEDKLAQIAQEETDTVEPSAEPKKRGRKPNTQNQQQ